MNSAIGKCTNTTCCACLASKSFPGQMPSDAGHGNHHFSGHLGWTNRNRVGSGLVKVNENFSSVSSTLDLKTLSSLTTVCGMSSRLIHVTVVPTATVNALAQS